MSESGRDIVDRLDIASHGATPPRIASLLREAGTEIERVRVELAASIVRCRRAEQALDIERQAGESLRSALEDCEDTYAGPAD